MPQQVVRWIEFTVIVVLAIYLFRPQRKPPSHPVPSGDALLLLKRLLSRAPGNGRCAKI